MPLHWLQLTHPDVTLAIPETTDYAGQPLVFCSPTLLRRCVDDEVFFNNLLIQQYREQLLLIEIDENGVPVPPTEPEGPEVDPENPPPEESEEPPPRGSEEPPPRTEPEHVHVPENRPMVEPQQDEHSVSDRGGFEVRRKHKR